VSVVDEAFRSYRLDSIAWGNDDWEQHDDQRRRRRRRRRDEPVVWSAGWQSDMSLYDTINEDFPSGFEWSTKEEDDEDGYTRDMELVGMDAARLRPCNNAKDALDRIAKSTGTSSLKTPFITAIQRQGDLLLIPAHCWHQTYAPVPSLAVASQQCGAMIDGGNVVGHVLDVVNLNNWGKQQRREVVIPDELKRSCHEEGSGKEIVKQLIKYVTMTQGKYPSDIKYRSSSIKHLLSNLLWMNCRPLTLICSQNSKHIYPGSIENHSPTVGDIWITDITFTSAPSQTLYHLYSPS